MVNGTILWGIEITYWSEIPHQRFSDTFYFYDGFRRPGVGSTESGLRVGANDSLMALMKNLEQSLEIGEFKKIHTIGTMMDYRYALLSHPIPMLKRDSSKYHFQSYQTLDWLYQDTIFAPKFDNDGRIVQ